MTASLTGVSFLFSAGGTDDGGDANEEEDAGEYACTLVKGLGGAGPCAGPVRLGGGDQGDLELLLLFSQGDKLEEFPKAPKYELVVAYRVVSLEGADCRVGFRDEEGA
jgi:hypothetical protein